MIAVDTNVLVRYFVQDEPRQARAANELIDRALHSSEKIFVSIAVLCETVWVLERAYRVREGDVVSVVEQMLANPAFELQSPGAVESALAAILTSKLGFVDLLIGSLAREAGASITYTFDRKLGRLEMFSIV